MTFGIRSRSVPKGSPDPAAENRIYIYILYITEYIHSYSLSYSYSFL